MTAILEWTVCSANSAESAFTPGHLSTDPFFTLPLTVGSAFGLQRTAPDAIQITRIGVYDHGSDGLQSSHEIGMWEYLNDGRYNLVASSIVPAGTAAELANGYRFVSITPVTIQPWGRFVIGALYLDGITDLSERPDSVSSSPEPIIVFPAGVIGGFPQTKELSVPTRQISRGEGLPNASFYPVNFQFEIIPEPSPLGLFALGLGGIVWGKRLRSRRQSAAVPAR